MEENTSKILVGKAAAPASASLPSAGGSGSALFVINLCASQAPDPKVGKSLPGLDGYRLYQVSRVEDGRTRYRLRLGFFTSEGDAENVLARVREKYPTAFTTCLCDEDRKYTRGFMPDTAIAAPMPAPPKQAPAPTPVVTRSAPTPAAVKPAAAAPTPTKEATGKFKQAVAPAAAPDPEIIELTWEPDEAPAASKAAPAPSWAPPALEPKTPATA